MSVAVWNWMTSHSPSALCTSATLAPASSAERDEVERLALDLHRKRVP